MKDSSPILSIPPFRPDGYLPEGLFLATEAEILLRFGSSNRLRRRLALRLRRWIELSRLVGAKRLFIDGSFVTAKEEPGDLDAALFLPADFSQHLQQEYEPAMALEDMLSTRCPEESFAAEDEGDWADWVGFFSRTREFDGRFKGLVEVVL